jgi:HAD superfamily phosphatase
VKAVLFDMDGVLVDVSDSYRLAIKQTVESFSGDEISLETIQEYKNRGGLNNDWDLTECILRERGFNVQKKKIVALFQRFYLGEDFDGLIRRERWMMPEDILTVISQNYKTGIVTGRPREEAVYTLKHFDKERFFQVVITMDDVPEGRGKPDPLGIQIAMKRLKATDGWYIGDTVDDMVAAKRAKLTPILNKSFLGGPGGRFFKKAPLAAGGLK